MLPQDLDIPENPNADPTNKMFQSNIGDPDWFWYNLAIFFEATKHQPRQYT